MTPEARTEYIVACIRKGAAMYPEDAEKLLAEHNAHRRAQVLTEAVNLAEKFTERWPDWDAMKADGIIGPFTAFGALADELRRMAAAEPDPGDDDQPPAGEPTPAPDFFQPGHTYRINDGVERADFLGWIFRAEHISNRDGKRTAFGYLTNRHPDSAWNPHFEGEESWAQGWDDITEDGGQ